MLWIKNWNINKKGWSEWIKVTRSEKFLIETFVWKDKLNAIRRILAKSYKKWCKFKTLFIRKLMDR